MIPLPFEYAAPKSLQEAIGLLESRGEGAKVVAGGQSVIPLLKLRLASPTLLVDITRISGLDYIRESEGSLRIGALTRMADVGASEAVKRRYHIIGDASKVIADPLVRNLGTVGGNICHGDPANDMPAVMLALGAGFLVTGPTGSRTIKAEDFFQDTFAVALGPSEILTEIRVPAPAPRSGGSYVKFEQKAGDFATAAAAVQLRINSRGECESVGIGLTAVAPTALKAKGAEEFLRGRKPTDRKAVMEAARLASGASTPASDIRGTSRYKRELVGRLVATALRRAHARALKGGAG